MSEQRKNLPEQAARIARAVQQLLQVLPARGFRSLGLERGDVFSLKLDSPPRVEPASEEPERSGPAAFQVRAGEQTESAGDCPSCRLKGEGAGPIQGRGAAGSPLFLISELPSGAPATDANLLDSRAQSLINRILASVGLSPAQAFLTTAIKCRPAAAFQSNQDVYRACRTHLKAELASVDPGLVVILGRPAAQLVLSADQPMARLRGKIHRLGSHPAVVTYHPSHLVMDPKWKVHAWKDWRTIRSLLKLQARGKDLQFDGIEVDL